MRKILNKVIGKQAAQKSFGSSNCSYYFFGLGGDDSQSSSLKKIDFRRQCAPLDTAFTILEDEIKSIKPVLWDSSSKKFIYDHPFLTLLEQINSFKDYDVFIDELNESYNATGDSFMIISAIGEDKPPVELDILSPQRIQIKANKQDGYPEEYTYQPGRSQRKLSFFRDPTKDNRFFSKDRNHELIQLKTGNLKSDLFGRSRIQSVELQILNYVKSFVHNNAMLDNQMRPSGILMYKGTGNLSTNEQLQLKDQLQASYQGTGNAGNAMVTQGDFDWIPLSESTKDMDFEKLTKVTSAVIFNKLKIPLPLISPENLSLSNMETAKLNLYDNAVKPLIETYYKFLSEKILKVRYKNGENLALKFDESQILALKPRMIENATKMSKLGALSPNEVRNMIGFEEAAGEGANQIYLPQNQVPIGTDDQIFSFRSEPSSANKEYDRDYIAALLKKNNMSQDEIEIYLKKHESYTK